MPTYRFRDTENGFEWEEMMSIEEKDLLLDANPELEQLITQVNIVRGVGGIKIDDGFKEVLSKISHAHPSSELAKEYGDKGIKETRIRNMIHEKRKKAGLATGPAV